LIPLADRPASAAIPPTPHQETAMPKQDDPIQASLRRYWRSNLRLMSVLLAIWAFAGLGCGILFADKLNAFHIPGTGFPLGFWFAQQGSILVFVLVILAYCIGMNRLDKRHHAELTRLGHRKEG
jgi:putative solute:sodium symporter small subunit